MLEAPLVPLSAVPVALRSYAAALPQLVVVQPRPTLMWLVGCDRAIEFCVGPLLRFVPVPVGRSIRDQFAGESEGWKCIAAHEQAFGGVQGRTRFRSRGRRWQVTVSPMFGLDGEVLCVVGSALLESPDDEEVRAIYAAVLERRPLTLVAVVDLPEHGLKEGDELAAAPSLAGTAAANGAAPAWNARALDPRTFADLVTAGLLVPTVPLTVPPEAPEAPPKAVTRRADPARAGVPAGPRRSVHRPRLGRPSGPVAIPVAMPAASTAPRPTPERRLRLL
jgi:hypothetical protein